VPKQLEANCLLAGRFDYDCFDGANAPERESLLSSAEHGVVNVRIDGANAPERESLLSSAEHGGVNKRIAVPIHKISMNSLQRFANISKNE